MKRLMSFLPVVLVLGLGITLNTGCTKEDVEVSNNGLTGNWTMYLSGDINYEIPMGINEIPFSSGGALTLSGYGGTNYYDLVTTVSETGELNINVITRNYDVTIVHGFIRGWLAKSGTGSGNYQISFLAPDGYHSLTGTWTATRN
ncbi:MAG: hypothetical protein IPN33_08580 [Saprospiraceae bacterium]|nr:hypothetical protein [Saprospiraceae bacterium]